MLYKSKNCKSFTKKLIVWVKNDDNNKGYPVMQTEFGFFLLALENHALEKHDLEKYALI
jgi:hypothetical protein